MRALWTLLALTIVLLPLAGAALADEEPGGELVFRIYPLGEFTIGRISYIRPLAPVVSPDQVSDERHPLFGGEHEEPLLPLGTVDEIVELLRASVEPFFWEEREGADIIPLGERRIAVRATEAVQGLVAAKLKELERLVAKTVTIEVESLRVPRVRAEGLLDGNAPATLDGKALEQLRAYGTPGPAVSVTAFAGQMAVAWGGRQVSWVGDADVEVAQESSCTDPIVLVSNLGLMVQAMAVPSEDGKVLLGMDAALAEMASQRTVATQANGALHAPLHDVIRIRPVMHITSGEWAVLDGELPAGHDDAWVFLARVTVHDVERAATMGETHAGVVELGGGGRGRAEGRAEGAVLPIRFLDVRDLTTPVRSIRSRPPALWPSNFTFPQPWELADPEPAVSADMLVDLIRETDGGAVWEDPASIEMRSSMLIVRNTPEVLARVEAKIEALRRGLVWSVIAAVEIVDLPVSMADGLGGHGVLGAESQELLAAARLSGEATTLHAMRITSMRGARNAIRSGTHVSYLQDFEVEIAQASNIGNPVFLDVFSGSQLTLAAGLAPDGRSAQLDIDFSRTHVPMPMQKMSTAHGEIELPELEIFQLRTAVRAPFGQTVLVGSWAHEGRRRLLLITPVLR